MVYINDIRRTEAEHLEVLTKVLERLQDRGLRLKRGKCKFLQPSVEYLGYRIDKEGLHPLASKVAAIVEAPTPKDVKELRAFLGLVNYYGKFIRQLSTVARPLNRLLGKGVPWTWSGACAEAFKACKPSLQRGPGTLRSPVTVMVRL